MRLLKDVIGYALFPVRSVLHGAHIRPYEICRELGIPLDYSRGLRSLPLDLLRGISRRNSLILFPGYTADQLSLLLIFLAKLRRCQLLLDVADIPYLQYEYFQGKPSGKSVNDFARLVHLADVLLFSTRGIQAETERRLKIGQKRAYLIENASDPHHFRFTPLPQHMVILYVGAYIPARGIDELIEAFRILRKRGHECILRLIGFGYPSSLTETGVEIVQNVDYDNIPTFFEESYVFVIPHRSNLYMRIAAPIKLFDAMASGRPIVTTPCDETAAMIKKENCGLVTGADPVSIADGIEYLLKNRDTAGEMGRNGRIAIEKKASWKVRAMEIKRILQENG